MRNWALFGKGSLLRNEPQYPTPFSPAHSHSTPYTHFNYTPICHTHTRLPPRSLARNTEGAHSFWVVWPLPRPNRDFPHSHLARALVLRTHASQLTCPLRLISAFPPPPPAAQRRFRFAIRPSRHPLPLRPCRQQTALGTYGWTVGGGLRWGFLRPPLHLRRPFPRRLRASPAGCTSRRTS